MHDLNFTGYLKYKRTTIKDILMYNWDENYEEGIGKLINIPNLDE